MDTPYAERLVKVAGDDLYFTGNYGQAYSVYRYRIAGGGEVYGLMDNPFARDGVAVGDDIYFVSLLPDGEAIYRTARKGKGRYTWPEGVSRKLNCRIHLLFRA